MSKRHHPVQKTRHPQFVTCCIVGQTPIFNDPESVQSVLEVCREMQQQGRLTVYGYVLLEDRFHLVASADDLGKEIDALKSAATGRIIQSLRQRQSRGLLGQLNRCQAEDQAEGTYRLWEDGDPPELIQNKEAMQQKLEFIHRNPVERGYATDPTDWQYSSARDYAGQPGGLPVATDW